MKVPSTVPVMPLPNAILFPHAVLPLRIFEPRYREMLRDSLETHRMFSVALMRHNTPAGQTDAEPYDVAGLGVVRASFDRPDGTSNLLLQGVCRVRLTRFLDGKPYRLAVVEEMASTHVKGVRVDALAAKVAELAELRGASGKPVAKPFVKMLVAMEDAEVLGDLVASTLLRDPRQQQQLLEMLDLRLRLRKLIQCLQRQIEQLKAGPQASQESDDDLFGAN
jgi:Lon protease-like protein